MSTPDRIEKKKLLRAPRARVWRALTDAREFGLWFGVKLEGAFAPGAHIRGKITIKGYEDRTMEVWIEKIEPERMFSYRWHPFAVDPSVDYSNEPTTLVEMTLSDAEGGTLLTVVETGFDSIPLARRSMAFEMNTHGWGAQLENIERYLGDAK